MRAGAFAFVLMLALLFVAVGQVGRTRRAQDGGGRIMLEQAVARDCGGGPGSVAPVILLFLPLGLFLLALCQCCAGQDG